MSLDRELRNYITKFNQMINKGDHRAELLLRRIRLKHPIFHLLTINAFKYLFETCNLLKAKPGQCLYKEYQPAKPNIYFVMYGQMELKNSKVGKFGDTLGLGWTIGEEVLYSESDDQHFSRLENCQSVGHSCLLQCAISDLVIMATQKHVKAGGGNLEQDYKILLSFLEKNYEVKTEWRKKHGLFDQIPELGGEDIE